MKSFSMMRVVTGVALGAVLALSYVEGTFAADCTTTNTYYDGTTGSNGGVIDENNDCLTCPTGTTAAFSPQGFNGNIQNGNAPAVAF